MKTKIYHNPRCQKSRQTLALLKEKGEQLEVIEYLKTPPTASELQKIVKLLDFTPEQLLRKGEAIFKEHFKGKTLSPEKWIIAMTENPKLIERPIVVKGNQAAIGRPPEKVLDIL